MIRSQHQQSLYPWRQSPGSTPSDQLHYVLLAVTDSAEQLYDDTEFEDYRVVENTSLNPNPTINFHP